MRKVGVGSGVGLSSRHSGLTSSMVKALAQAPSNEEVQRVTVVKHLLRSNVNCNDIMRWESGVAAMATAKVSRSAGGVSSSAPPALAKIGLSPAQCWSKRAATTGAASRPLALPRHTTAAVAFLTASEWSTLWRKLTGSLGFIASGDLNEGI